MSTISDNFFKDGTFGRRLFAMIASFYGIAVLLYGRNTPDGITPGYEVIASVLRAMGLNGVADWIVNTLVASLQSNPITPVAAALVLLGAVVSMTATFRITTYNVSPQAAFAYLFAACLLIDFGTCTLRTMVILTVVVAIAVGLFCLLPSRDQDVHGSVVALMLIASQVGALLYGPAKILSWFVTDSGQPTVSVALERGTGPVKVEVVEGDGPMGARP